MYNGQVHYSPVLNEKRLTFLISENSRKRRILKKNILSYNKPDGTFVVVNDSVFFAHRSGFNKLYSDLKPICADYESRVIKYDCKKILGYKPFLNICSHIDDKNVARDYEHYLMTHKKRNNLMTGGVVSITLAGICYLGATYMLLDNILNLQEKWNSEIITGLYISSLAFFIPAATFGILTTLKNIKKKKILYRDLPASYNNYLLKKSDL